MRPFRGKRGRVRAGDLEELDRDLVEQAKTRLQNGETLQRPLDLFDKAPVQKITYSKETALVVARVGINR